MYQLFCATLHVIHVSHLSYKLSATVSQMSVTRPAVHSDHVIEICKEMKMAGTLLFHGNHVGMEADNLFPGIM